MHTVDVIITLLALLGVGIIAAGLLRRLPIPYTVALVLIGIGLQYFGVHEHIQTTPDMVLFIFLPLLIFESALNLNARQLSKNLIPVITLAIPALFLSAVFIAIVLNLLFSVPFQTAMIFGALISATDPVAVVALFKSLGAPQRLTTLLEGESLFNDATAIVLFSICLGLATSHTTMDGHAALMGLLEFIEVFVGGILVGVLTGSIIALAARVLHWKLPEIIVATLVCAYCSFVMAEHYLHTSGVMGVVASSLIVAIFLVPRLTQDASFAVSETWDFLVLIANTLLFLMMGLTINLYSIANNWLIIVVAFLAMLLIRSVSIFGLLPLVLKTFHLPRVDTAGKTILWWGGLRGGLAIAMVLSIPDDFPGQTLLLDLTIGCVFATLVINAPTIKPLMQWFGLNKPNEFECIEIEHTQQVAHERAHAYANHFLNGQIISKAGLKDIEHKLKAVFEHGHTHENVRDERLTLELTMLEHEVQTLKQLFESGAISQYIFLEISDELERKREHILAKHEKPDFTKRETDSIFEKIESWVIKSLREKNWATGLLARYQMLRQSDFLIKSVVHLQMAQAVQTLLASWDKLPKNIVDECIRLNQAQIELHQHMLAESRMAFPEFYRRFMRNFVYKASLSVALTETENDYHAGGIGAKALSFVETEIESAIEHLPDITEPVKPLSMSELIRMVPFCQDLPKPAVEALVEHLKTVKFLPGDTVIEQGQKGDSLYIIMQGSVDVMHVDKAGHSHRLAVLSAGDFVGEMALLDEQVRQASIIATVPSTLLRITRQDVMEIGRSHPELIAALEKVKAERAQ